MDLQVFQQELIQKAKSAGFVEAEVYIQKEKEFEVRIMQKELAHYANSSVRGVSFRGIYEGKMGYAFAERIDEEIIDLLIEEARQNAMIIEDEEKEELYGGDSTYPQVESFNQSLEAITAEEKIEAAKTMESAAYAADPRVKAVDYTILAYGEEEKSIYNTKGLQVSHGGNYGLAYVSARVEENSQVKTASRFWVGTDWNTFDPKQLGQEAAKEALSYLGAEPVPSKAYPILLRNDAAADLLQTFVSVFYADQVQKGFSLLQGKLGEAVGSTHVSIRDDGLYEGGISSTPFDSEGVATSNKAVIEKGVLKTFLHNLKTAKKDGVTSTGNGFKASYKASVQVAPTNFYIVPGECSYEALMEEMGSGLIITSLQGLHSGANTVSGDFSLAAAGYLVEGGKIAKPVEQITIAGNFFEVLKDTLAVGADLQFNMPSGGAVGSPSLYIKSLAVAGV